MANDLTEIVSDTESSLAAQPPQYSNQLESFSGRDERILANFLREERDSSPHYTEYKDYALLVGIPKKFTRPKKFMVKKKQAIPKLERKLQDILVMDTDIISEIGITPKTIDVIRNLPDMFGKMVSMETRLYESVVAYAKQIGKEKSISPIDVVRSSDNREEIYRRAFKTRSQFELYNTTSVQTDIALLGITYNMLESVGKYIGEIENIPVIGKLFKIAKNRLLKHLPSTTIADSFFRKEIDYNLKKAEKIYGNISGTSKIIEAEIVR